VAPADRQALLRAACRMPAERAERIEAVGRQTDGAPPGMPAAGRVLGEIELAGDLRSEWPATNSSPAAHQPASGCVQAPGVTHDSGAATVGACSIPPRCQDPDKMSPGCANLFRQGSNP
jgi:hypothetical protein